MFISSYLWVSFCMYGFCMVPCTCSFPQMQQKSGVQAGGFPYPSEQQALQGVFHPPPSCDPARPEPHTLQPKVNAEHEQNQLTFPSLSFVTCLYSSVTLSVPSHDGDFSFTTRQRQPCYRNNIFNVTQVFDPEGLISNY